MATSRDEVESLLAQIRALSGHAGVARLTDQISVLCRGALAPTPARGWEDFALTKLESRLMRALCERLDKVVGKPALMDALYFDRVADEPEAKIVDILVCKLRKKIRHSGYEIETVWGHGYRARLAKDIQALAQARALAMLAA